VAHHLRCIAVVTEDSAAAFLAKAEECLIGAEAALAAGR
jgi:hypothetical protein